MTTSARSANTKSSLGFVPQHEGEPDLVCSTDGACMLPAGYLEQKTKLKQDREAYHPMEGTPETAALLTDPDSSDKKTSIIDNIIEKIILFTRGGTKPKDRIPTISDHEVSMLCDLCATQFLAQPSLLELSPADTGITIIGDLHGHLNDLTAIFAKEGSPDIHNYLFLGNYVGSGRHQIELTCLLLCYKYKYPENFFLLRGAHETRDTNRNDGFWNECRSLYSEDIWSKFNKCFDTMPFAAVLGDRIFCVHSGLSPDLQALCQLRSIRRPTSVPANGLLYDLLWAGPTMTTPGWNVSDQGAEMVYGQGVSRQFFRSNELEIMIRGHPTTGKRFTLSADKKILSLFSATNYEERVNEASFAHIGNNLTVQVYCFDHTGVCQEQKL